MGRARKVGVVAAATFAIVLAATPASAYVVTGWQTNSGFNSIDGCTTYREKKDQSVKAVEVPACARDIGVRGKGTYSGGSFEIGFYTWDDDGAGQFVEGSYVFTAMKVAHGTH
jgi:hypothetical protein